MMIANLLWLAPMHGAIMSHPCHLTTEWGDGRCTVLDIG